MLIYGVCISDIEKLNEEKMTKFLEELKEKGHPQYLEDFVYAKQDDEDYSIFDWVDKYESEGYFGLSAFLRDVIRDIEQLQVACDDPDGIQYLGIPANLPWNFAGKTKNLSAEMFNHTLSSYVNKVCDDDALDIRLWSHNE